MDTTHLDSEIQFDFFEDDRWFSSQIHGSVDNDALESFLNVSGDLSLPSFLFEDLEVSTDCGQVMQDRNDAPVEVCPAYQVAQVSPQACKENKSLGVLKSRRKSTARSSSEANRKTNISLDGETKALRRKEPHFLCERQRRRNMQDQFKTLLSLIPYALPKTDKLAVLNATVDHIEDLKRKLNKLSVEKANLISSPAKDSASLPEEEKEQPSSRNLRIQVHSQGNDWCITVNNPSKAKLYSGIMLVLEKYGFDVLNWNISSHNNATVHTVRALQKQGPSNFSPELLKHSLSKLF